MKEEIEALCSNDTWDLIPQCNDMKFFGCKWGFKVKLKYDGTLEHLEVRLVAKGYTQIPRLDFIETFSLVVKPATMQVVLTVAFAHN